MTYPDTGSPEQNRRFAEEYIAELAKYPDGAALILRVADAIRSAATNGASSVHSAEVPQSNTQPNPQTSTTTSDGWNF